MANHSLDDTTSSDLELVFGSVGDFFERLGSRLSSDGFFLETEDTHPEGTAVTFVAHLENGEPLLQGRGEVAWVQGPEPGPGGMAIRMLELDPQSRQLVGSVVGYQKGKGTFSFHLQSRRWPPPWDAPFPKPSENSPESLSTSGFDGVEEAAEIDVTTEDAELSGFEGIVEAVELEAATEDGELSGFHGVVEAVELEATAEDGELRSFDEVVEAVEIDVTTEDAEPNDPQDNREPGEVELAAEESQDDESLSVERVQKRKGPGVRPRVLLALGLIGILGAAGTMLWKASWRKAPSTSSEPVFVPPDSVREVIDIPPLAVSRSGPAPTFSEDELQTSPQEEDDHESEVAGPPMNQVRLITWKDSDEGTRVTLWGNGIANADRCITYPMTGRLLLKILGIDWPVREPVLEVMSPEILRIRSGFHPGPEGNELHIVFDLADPQADLLGIEADGEKLLLTLGRPPEESEVN